MFGNEVDRECLVIIREYYTSTIKYDNMKSTSFVIVIKITHVLTLSNINTYKVLYLLSSDK
jgi:hypothetical protein